MSTSDLQHLEAMTALTAVCAPTNASSSSASLTPLEKLFPDVSVIPDDGYGFFQLLLLLATYGCILTAGSHLIKDGSEMLLLVPSWAGLVGSIVLPILGSIPDCAIILFSGMGPHAQKQLGVGIGALAGSTIMLLTVPWFLSLMAGRVNLDSNGRGNYVRPRGAGKEWTKLTPGKFAGTGVNVGPSIIHAAMVMAVTIIPFFVIQIPAMVDKCTTKKQFDDGVCKTPHVAAIVAGALTVILFFVYLAIQKRQADHHEDLVTEGKIDHERSRAVRKGLMSMKGIFTLAHVQDVKHETKHGEEFQRMLSGGAYDMSHEELKDPKFRKFLKPYFKRFDLDKSGVIHKQELKLLLESLGERPTKADLDGIFEEMDTSKSGTITFDEFADAMTKIIVASVGGDDHPFASPSRATEGRGDAAPADELLLNDEGGGTGEDIIGASNADDGGISSDDDEEEKLLQELAHLSPDEQRKRILQRSFLLMGAGTAIVVFFSNPMVDALSKLGEITHVPAFYVSFLLAPLVSNGSELIAAFSYAGKKTEKTMTIALATLIGSATMNNTMCLAVFLFLVAGKNLQWVFTAEITSIVFVEIVMLIVIFVLRTSMPTWTAGLVISLYPVSLVIVYLMENVAGLD